MFRSSGQRELRPMCESLNCSSCQSAEGVALWPRMQMPSQGRRGPGDESSRGGVAGGARKRRGAEVRVSRYLLWQAWHPQVPPAGCEHGVGRWGWL